MTPEEGVLDLLPVLTRRFLYGSRGDDWVPAVPLGVGSHPLRDRLDAVRREVAADLLAAVVQKELGQRRAAGHPAYAGDECHLYRRPRLAWRCAYRAAFRARPLARTEAVFIGPLEDSLTAKLGKATLVAVVPTLLQDPGEGGPARASPDPLAERVVHSAPRVGWRRLNRPVRGFRVPSVLRVVQVRPY